MQNPLNSIFQGNTYNPQGGGTFNPQAGIAVNPQAGTYNPQTNNQTLPNGGGTYNPAGKSTITPEPVFTGAPTQSQTPAPATNQLQMPKEYINPKTGQLYSDDEYANNVAKMLPINKGGDVGKYAGDAVTNPNQTTAELTGRATDLNNARNDIATGTTDPYDITKGGTVVYSPTEREAIQDAYAGVYNPVLKDVFARLEENKAKDKQAADKEEIVFRTNESIRQWRATTGTKSSGSGADSYKFSNTQLGDGASLAGMGLEAFNAIESNDIKNYWINPPTYTNPKTDESKPFHEKIQDDIKRIENGQVTQEEIAENIMKTRIAADVKFYLIEMLPATPEQKKGWWQEFIDFF